MEEWDAVYSMARTELGLARGIQVRPRRVRVVFRPLAGLRATIYERGDHYEVRASELLREAPVEAHVGLAKLLVGKMERRLRATKDETAAWFRWSRSPEMTARHDAARRARGRKRIASPQGAAHDLDAMFDRLNLEYFGGMLPKSKLGWTLRRSRSLYGHHDPAHDAIVLNRLLDHPRVPPEVVASVLHHEMLHVKHGVRQGSGSRRIVHSRAFRADERRYAHHAEASKWLRDLEARRIRLRPVEDKTLPAKTPFTPRSLLPTVLERFFGARSR